MPIAIGCSSAANWTWIIARTCGVTVAVQIGRVLEGLDANGLTENTIVIFTSDNGGERFADTWPFTGKKTDLLEGGLRIPMVIAWPVRIAPGRTSDQVAISMDWLPTLLAAAGTAPDPGYPPDGMDLLPGAHGQRRSGRSKAVLALQGEVAARRAHR
jgi:arylsulfatase A-like enzyme